MLEAVVALIEAARARAEQLRIDAPWSDDRGAVITLSEAARWDALANAADAEMHAASPAFRE